MAIYTRNEEGQLIPLRIPAIKGPKGDKGDPGQNIQSDWNESDSSSGAYINNKPNIAKNLDDLEDVEASIVKDKDVLLYNDKSKKWEATTLMAGETRNILSYSAQTKQWQPMPLFPNIGDNGSLSKDVHVVGTSVGNIKEGEVLPEGMTFTEFVEKLLIKRILPTYTKPTMGISNLTGTKFELGSTVSINIKPTFNKNDGGNLMNYILYKNNEFLYSDIELSNYQTTMVLDGKVQFKGEIEYDDGPIKNDNLDTPCEEGQILRNKISATINIDVARAYWGFQSDTPNIPNAESIRSTDIAGLSLANNSKIVVTANASTRVVVFAYPATLRDCTKIRYEELADDNNKSVFQQILLEIPDASGLNPTTYRVYYYVSPIPFGSTATFTLTV